MAYSDLSAILAKYTNAQRDALIPLLQEVQEEHGFLSREAIAAIAKHLRLPASKIYGVATFYNHFRFQPLGRYHFMLCRGTACHVKGSLNCLEMVIKLLKIKPGQTTRDGLFSLEVVACMGSCARAPVVAVNGEFYTKVTPIKLARIIAECREKELSLAHA